MPLVDLHFLRQKCDIVESTSRFRGEVVESLHVKADVNESERYTAYSEIINRRSCITPYFWFDVFMSPDIKPETLLSLLDGKNYIELHLRGNYHWRDIIPFLHMGLKFVRLIDNMDLPAKDLRKFFKTLIRFDTYEYSFYYEKGDYNWVKRANKAWDSVKKGSKFHLRFSTSYCLDGNGVNRVHFILHRHGYYFH
uniref:FTH domain-containing protein n=1 Tax=Panagrellus redivivus TaxID=6233 RepID=A0A7E4V9S1_PANRE